MQIFGPHPTSQEITMGIVTFNYWTIAGLAVDVMMSGILARFCWKHKTGIEHIDSAVMRYFIVATESSLWPGLCLLIAVILFHSGNVMAERVVFIFLMMTGKLYVISILRMLNAREPLRERLGSKEMCRVSISGWAGQESQTHGETASISRSEAILSTVIGGPRSPQSITSSDDGLGAIERNEIRNDTSPERRRTTGPGAQEALP